MKAAFDLSSYIWHNMLAGKDREHGFEVYFEDKKVWINSAQYGYEIAVGQICKVLRAYELTPIDTILVVEGINSKSKRMLISNLYKAKRKEQAPEAYIEFEKCRAMLQQTFLELGACVMTQDYAEGDDTLAYLAENTEEDLIVATFDNDLSALNGVNQYGAEIETWIDGLTGVNKYGIFDHHLITTYKALVGDTSDNISGCPGFGPATWTKLINKHGLDCLDQIQEELEKGSLGWIHELAEDCDIIKKICKEEKAVVTSYELAKLRPEWVNTMKAPLQIQAGMVRQLRKDDDERLKQWYGRSRLITSDNFNDAVAWALPLVRKSPFISLDLETSTGEESDEWLARQGDPEGVDVLGSTITGMGLTFGDNNQFSLYFSVDHAETNNVNKADLRKFLEQIIEMGHEFIIHNTAFELVVMFMEYGDDWKDNGHHGFLPNVRDTLFEASYVNENIPLGLKGRSMTHLGYQQVEYDEVTTLAGPIESLPKGGRLVREWYEGDPVEGEEPPATHQARKYKMNELTAKHVLKYGLDDTICTAALHNYFKLVMQLEHTYNVYLEVELDAAYLHAKSFLDGADVSIEKLNELAAEDTVTYDKAWSAVSSFLIAQGWEGTVCPVYDKDITPAQIKEAYEIVIGEKLDTKMRTISKIVTYIGEVVDQPILAAALQALLDGDDKPFNGLVAQHFNGEPESPVGSSKKMGHLMYEVMQLPVRVHNKATDTMRAAGIYKGTPKTDALAIAYALQDASPEHKEVLESLKLMQMVQTRRSLYYSSYPGFVHWKDGRIHSSHRQSSTNTRRASESKPNKQQLPKHPKIEGYLSRFREVIVPHKKNAVIVSLDFDSQELRVIAEYSQDQGMLDCFIGENKRSMHSITGLGILQKEHSETDMWRYEDYVEAMEDKAHPLNKETKASRVLGKKVNFTTEFGAQKAKLAQTMMISEDEAQSYIDAKEAAFPEVVQWKQKVIKEAKSCGYTRTMLGAVRHLRDAFILGDKWTAMKAERQSVNFKVQSSSAEMTKRAEGRIWSSGLLYKYDCRYIGVIHDETVFSTSIEDLHDFLVDAWTCVVAPYANMRVPIESGISFGKDFFNQIEVGMQPTKEAVDKGLAKLLEAK